MVKKARKETLAGSVTDPIHGLKNTLEFNDTNTRVLDGDTERE